MTDQDKLATAMGYVKISNYTGSFADQQGTEHWTHPDGYVVFEVPDPKNDATDCNALIKHLNELKYDVQIRHNFDDRSWVRLEGGSAGTFRWKGDNWMHGVCTLALKVIDSDN